MGTMKESYEQMEMKRLAAQRKKEKAQAAKDKERVRQQVRYFEPGTVISRYRFVSHQPKSTKSTRSTYTFGVI